MRPNESNLKYPVTYVFLSKKNKESIPFIRDPINCLERTLLNLSYVLYKMPFYRILWMYMRTILHIYICLFIHCRILTIFWAVYYSPSIDTHIDHLLLQYYIKCFFIEYFLSDLQQFSKIPGKRHGQSTVSSVFAKTYLCLTTHLSAQTTLFYSRRIWIFAI